MTVSASRYVGQTVVNSTNLFIDTERSRAPNEGDDTRVTFGGTPLEANDDEMIRLTLTNFTMYNSVYDVNHSNNRFRLLCRTGNTNDLFDQQFFIPIGNYPSKRELATAFANSLRLVLFQAEQAGTNNITSFQVNTGALRPQAGNSARDLLVVQLDTRPANANHGLTQIVVQCLTEQGDAYQLVGGERVDDSTGLPESAPKSFRTTINTTNLVLEGFFPMQLQTESTVYIRTDCGGSNLESSILTGAAEDSRMVNSNILAKVQKDVEFIHYDSPTNTEYFINLQTRRLSSLRLFLTDSKGRKLGRLGSLPNETNGTASGLSTAAGVFASPNQSTLGNLFFNCVIRADIIKIRESSNLQTTAIPPMLPARIAQAPYSVQDYGRPKH